MASNIHTPSADRGRRRGYGVMPPSRRSNSGLLQWIREAQATQRTWARNALIAFGILFVILLLAMRLGLLTY